MSDAATKVLVVDDDPSLLKALRIGLHARGDEVLTARTGVEAVNQVALGLPDLVILDLGLPDLDGIEVCRRIREFSHVPIVVLSAYGDERRKVEALDSGADDFVTKPFGMAELEARLRVALRHGVATHGDRTGGAETIEVGDLEIDFVHHMATLRGELVQLTAREFELLAYLARHAGKVCTHHMILKDVWGPGYGAESNYVRVYTHRLRKKLGDENGHLVHTIPGIGYQLTAEAHPEQPLASEGAPHPKP
jgi:two-component system, OmpR family, KDP operon response regulator KdpE